MHTFAYSQIGKYSAAGTLNLSTTTVTEIQIANNTDPAGVGFDQVAETDDFNDNGTLDLVLNGR